MQKEKLEIVRGDDVSFRLKFQTQDGNPFDLLGARFDLHAKVEGQLVLALSTEDDSIRILEQGVLGKVESWDKLPLSLTLSLLKNSFRNVL